MRPHLPLGARAPISHTWREGEIDSVFRLISSVKKGSFQLHLNLAQGIDSQLFRMSHIVVGIHPNLRQDTSTVLVHGYLWDQNVGTEISMKEVFIFDESAYYARREMEIAG